MDTKDKPYTGLAMAREICKNRRQRAERAKKDGQQVIGYYCCFPPAELIKAAYLFPYRISGDIHEPVTEGAVYLDTNMCPFLRSSFDLAMKGKYYFLDGIVVPNACRNMRRFHVFWRDNVKPAYVHYLNVPHTATSASIDFYEAELTSFKESLEKFTKVKISDERLNEVIGLYNKNRALLRKINAMRKYDPPLLSGVEMLETVIAGMTIPAEEATGLYESLLQDITERRETPKKKRRLLVYGSVIDNVDFFRLVEDCGINVVSDDLCFGTRSYLNDVETGRNPLGSLSRYYLGKTMCPRTYRETPEERFGHIKQLAQEFQIDGVLLYAVRFCDSVKLEVPAITDYLQQAGLPVLSIEDDYTMSSAGTLRTKVQAFVEMIK
jgi:benzoyl-CoA reductase subunit C